MHNTENVNICRRSDFFNESVGPVYILCIRNFSQVQLTDSTIWLTACWRARLSVNYSLHFGLFFTQTEWLGSLEIHSCMIHNCMINV